MKVLALFAIVLLAMTAVAQEKPRPYEFATFDATKETSKEFAAKLKVYLKALKKQPDASGFVAIHTGNYRKDVEFRDLADPMVDKDKSLRMRVSVWNPGFSYRPLVSSTAFWIIPKGADQPYEVFTADYFCPSIEVVGKPMADNVNERLIFTGNFLSGSGGPLTFHWTVAGGKIISGQNSQSITVKIDKHKRVDKGDTVVATMYVFGLPKGAACLDRPSFTTVLARPQKEY